jgi:hypothetical protein
MGALDNRHDGSILDNRGGFFGGGVNQDAKQDGLGILGHILGGSQNNVVGALSKNSGMDTDSVMKILTLVAPIVLGHLGKQKKEQNASDQNGIGGLLGRLLSGGTQEALKQQAKLNQFSKATTTVA